MPIYLNGGPNPQAVSFNGRQLDSVYARVGSASALVWETGSAPLFPSTLQQLRVGVASGVDMYVRDSTFVRSEGLYNPTTHQMWIFGYYSCDISLDLSWPRYELVGAAYSPPIDWRPSTCNGSLSVSGLPSGYMFSQVEKSQMMNLDFLQTQEGHYDIGYATIRTNADCEIYVINPSYSSASSARAGLIVHADAGNHALYTPSTGLITQGSATLVIIKQ